MESCIAQTCAASAQGNSPFIFHQLIQMLLVSQCTLGQHSDYPPDKRQDILSNPDEPFDFIVVGGGTAGSAVAARLSENKDWRVLLIEAGSYPSAISDVPGLLLLLQGSSEDYDYVLEHQDNFCLGMKGNRCKWAKGKVLGGSSVLNAMLHVHGNDRDYDSWAELGNDGWRFEDVLPYFKKSENYPAELIAKYGDKYVGSSGPVSVRSYNYTDSRVPEVILEAIQERGIPILDYVNNGQPVGFGKSYGTLDNSRRVNAAKAYLSPAKDRKNLFVVTSTRADQILIDGNKAVGVRVTLPDNKSLDLKASKEVIISAGSIATPQLLMLSGIGPKEHLDELGIPCKADLSVGKNLQDHLIWLGVQLEFFNESTVTKGPLNFLDEAYSYLMHGRGEFSHTGGIDLIGFVNVDDPAAKYPNMQFHHIYVPRTYGIKAQMMAESMGLSEELTAELLRLTAVKDTIFISPTLLKPKSAGEIKLRSSDPGDPVRIWANYLHNEDDKIVMLRAIDFLKDLTTTEVFKKHGITLRQFNIPGCKDFKADSVEYWECNLRHTAGTVYHPAGTARMGPAGDPVAVVDTKLKVHGFERLRVIDASIIPILPSANTNSPVLMIAEKGADMIKKEWSGKDEL